MLRLQTNYRIMNILQIYTPIEDKHEEELEKWYNEGRTTKKNTKEGNHCHHGRLEHKSRLRTAWKSASQVWLRNHERMRRKVDTQFCIEHDMCL